MADLITLEQYLTASGTYPERATHKELTDKYKENAKVLLKIVNQALKDLGIKSVRVSSGFRPSSVNKATKGAAKVSSHLSCEAIDLVDDKNQSLCKLFTKEVLEKYNLFREDSDATIGKVSNWIHLQTRKTASGKRIFKP